jgi:hypothetical protein
MTQLKKSKQNNKMTRMSKQRNKHERAAVYTERGKKRDSDDEEENVPLFQLRSDVRLSAGQKGEARVVSRTGFFPVHAPAIPR